MAETIIISDSQIRDMWNQAGVKDNSSLFWSCLLHCSVEKSPEEAVKEWKYYGQVDVETFCVCSQVVTRNFYIVNNKTGMILRVCQSCINKFMPMSLQDEVSIIVKQLRYQKSGTGAHRMCGVCLRHSIPINEPSWKVTCKTCFKKGSRCKEVISLDNRNCEVCLKPVIPPDTPIKITMCTPCFKRQQTLNNRQCSKCYKFNIPETEPEWKKTCKVCYAKQMSK